MIKAANTITDVEYQDGIFVMEDDSMMSDGWWWIPDDWTPGNRHTLYARWFATREDAEAARAVVRRPSN
jgi:hypothetical protein